MAARKTKTLSENWRAKIRTSMLVNRLSDLVEGKIEMQPHQVTAALGLLKKTAPDLSATTLEAGADLAEALKGIKVTFGS